MKREKCTRFAHFLCFLLVLLVACHGGEPSPGAEPTASPVVTITYCTMCGYEPDARELADEIRAEVTGVEVVLDPEDEQVGIFRVSLGDVILWREAPPSAFEERTLPEASVVIASFSIESNNPSPNLKRGIASP